MFLMRFDHWEGGSNEKRAWGWIYDFVALENDRTLSFLSSFHFMVELNLQIYLHFAFTLLIHSITFNFLN